MKIVIASDKWKGCLSAVDACAALERGLREIFSAAEFVAKPIADGGEGTVQAVLDALPRSRRITSRVRGPLGDVVDASYALLPDGDAVIEAAAAAGLALIRHRPLEPWHANTFGVGQLMADAVGHRARRVIVGLGGSATNDGGGGMAQALGWQFDDAPQWPADWTNLRRITPPAQPLGAEVVAACDVTNPLFGLAGCTRVFGPQKGVRPQEFERFDLALERLAGFFDAKLTKRPGAGAAGGLGWGLMAFCEAKTASGFDLIADLIALEKAVADADLVVTGEGSLDFQTLNGKGPHGVARMARKHGKKVVGIGGRVTAEARPAFDLSFAVTPRDMSSAVAIPQARELIVRSICQARDELLGLVR
jgi:glycerate kinase